LLKYPHQHHTAFRVEMISVTCQKPQSKLVPGLSGWIGCSAKQQFIATSGKQCFFQQNRLDKFVFGCVQLYPWNCETRSEPRLNFTRIHSNCNSSSEHGSQITISS